MHRGVRYIEIYHTAWNVITPRVPGYGLVTCNRGLHADRGSTPPHTGLWS